MIIYLRSKFYISSLFILFCVESDSLPNKLKRIKYISQVKNKEKEQKQKKIDIDIYRYLFVYYSTYSLSYVDLANFFLIQQAKYLLNNK